MWSACSKKSPPAPSAATKTPSGIAASVPRPPAAAQPADVRKTGFEGVATEIECAKPEFARAVAEALERSELWHFYLRDRRELRRLGEPPLVQFRLQISTVTGSESGRTAHPGVALHAQVDSIETPPGAIRCIVTAGASANPAGENATFPVAPFADELALALIVRDHPAPWRLEQQVLAFAAKSQNASNEAIRQCVQALALAGCFDSAVAIVGLDAAQTRGAQQVTLRGKDHLVEAARRPLAHDPLWTLWFVAVGSPLEIALEARHESHELAVAPGGSVLSGAYDPGTGFARVTVRNPAGAVLHDTQTTAPTPTAVRVQEDPYLVAEQTAVVRNLTDAAARLTDSLPPDQRHVLMLAAELGYLWGEQPRYDHAEKVLLEVLRRFPAGTDTIVSGLGSRVDRTNDACARVLRKMGAGATAALVRGLSHPAGGVRSQCASELRQMDKGRLSAHLEEIIRRSIQTLNDDVYADSWSYSAFLLRDIGPRAAVAIPALQRMEQHSRRDGRYATEAIKAIQAPQKTY